MGEFIYKEIDDGTTGAMSYSGDDAHVTIPDDEDITLLNDDLFKGHEEITEVTIPDSVRIMGGFLFDGCLSLKSLILPQHLEEVWQYCFTRSGIEHIVLPGSLNTVPMYAFNECAKLESVTIEPGAERILAWAFRGCTSLKEIYIPRSVTEVSGKAFEGCDIVKVERY